MRLRVGYDSASGRIPLVANWMMVRSFGVDGGCKLRRVLVGAKRDVGRGREIVNTNF